MTVSQEFIRVFQSYHLEEVKRHMLIMGDLSAECGNCRELGIDAYAARTCPQCSAPFRFVTSRRLETHPGERFQWVKRVHEKRPDLIPMDYTDYTKLLGQKKARDFFG